MQQARAFYNLYKRVMRFRSCSLLYYWIFLLTHFSGAACCMFSAEPAPSTSLWNDTTKCVESVEGCSFACGLIPSEGPPPWIVLLEVSNKDWLGDVKVLCTGTVIAPNLVITSHGCLTRSGTRMAVYDVWRPKAGKVNMARPQDILVKVSSSPSTSGDPANLTNSNSTFSVKDVIYSMQYAFDSYLYDRFPKLDIALVVVDGDLQKQAGRIPICLPPDDMDPLELIKVQATMTGYLKAYDAPGASVEADQIETITGEILVLDNCFEEGDPIATNASHVDLLCFQFPAGMAPWGAPLTVKSTTGYHFLVGLTFDDGLPFLMGVLTNERVLFSTISPMLKYIGCKASGLNIAWCSPTFTVPSAGLTYASGDKWPWETISADKLQRDEILDCGRVHIAPAITCGVQNTATSQRIAGGEEADPREFGWMTLLRITRKHKRNICGASVINDRVILTAAHCVIFAKFGEEVEIMRAQGMAAYVNIHLLRDDREAIRLNVKSILAHPKHLPSRLAHGLDYDIALLILDQSIPFSKGEEGIKPICLPAVANNDTNLVGQNATVTGWGLTDPDDGSSTSSVLRKLVVQIRKLQVCLDWVRGIPDTFLCAGTLNKFRDAAGGDSGGPLMLHNEQKNQWTQVGIVSWGIDVNDPRAGDIKTVALYTDVQQMMSFVNYYSKRVRAQWCKN